MESTVFADNPAPVDTVKFPSPVTFKYEIFNLPAIASAEIVMLPLLFVTLCADTPPSSPLKDIVIAFPLPEIRFKRTEELLPAPDIVRFLISRKSRFNELRSAVPWFVSMDIV